MADWDYDKDYNGVCDYGNSYDGYWDYDSGYPNIIKRKNMSSASFERLGNAKVAAEVLRRLDVANRLEREKALTVLRETKTEVVCKQQSSKQGESCTDKFFNLIAEDITLLGQMADAVITGICEKRDRARELRKIRKGPIQRNIQHFNSTTTAISTTGIVR